MLPALRTLGVCSAFTLVLPPIAAGQTDRPQSFATETPKPPIIDGRLDDDVWRLARPIGGFTETLPVEGATPQDPTEVRVLFDRHTLFIGIRCFDSDPSGLISTTMERDGFFDSDDRIELILDTFLDRRNAFFFQINPAGSKGDALITNNGQDFNKPWDGIWQGKTTIDAEGWNIEMAIPFKTLSFDEGIDTWGFNLDRYVGRRNERQRWANPKRDTGLFQIYESGNLSGLQDLRQGIGIDVSPFLVGRSLDARGEQPDEGVEFDAGLDAFFKLTPGLTASLTINTDFAETEVDERQVNLTRFPLFFPERRDFFLQDAGRFEFSNLGSNLIPFFSRSVGLVGGTEIPLQVGGKLTGRAGDYSIGLLQVQTDTEGALEGQSLFAARVSRDVGRQSTVGAIVTQGNPDGSADNRVYGLDANFRTSEFLGDQQLLANVWGLASDTEGVDSGQSAFGTSLSYPNDLWNWSLQLFEIQENFEASMGFVPRTGIRRYGVESSYNPRPGDHVRQYLFEVSADVVTDLNDRLETSEIEIQPLGFELESGDEMHLEFTRTEERLDNVFEITDDVDILPGDYDYWNTRLEYQSAIKRVWSADTAISFGDFFDGERWSYRADVNWDPGAEMQASFGFEHNDIELAGGEFEVDVARLRFTRSFAPNLSWSNLMQWDSRSRTYGFHSRVRWIPEPGQEIFVVFNQSLDEPNGDLERVFQELAFKVVYTLRF